MSTADRRGSRLNPWNTKPSFSLRTFASSSPERRATSRNAFPVRADDALLGHDAGDEAAFDHILLEPPLYTRPAIFRGDRVPDILLSGNHAKIEEWRFRKALELTLKLRPDLLKQFLAGNGSLDKRKSKILEEFATENNLDIDK